MRDSIGVGKLERELLGLAARFSTSSPFFITKTLTRTPRIDVGMAHHDRRIVAPGIVDGKRDQPHLTSSAALLANISAVSMCVAAMIIRRVWKT